MATQKDIFESIVACQKLKKDSTQDTGNYISHKFNVPCGDGVIEEIKNQRRLLKYRYTNVYQKKKKYEEVAALGDNSEVLIEPKELNDNLINKTIQ